MGLVEMSDSVCESETASCTAITDKRQGHRSGGCAGILFRLFDWNRRFAKKKLFSRKLLPAAHQAKQTAKRFQGDEKMPIGKLHLIAEENKGSFSKLKKNVKGTDIMVSKQEMRAPCLVARLMGLDLIPAVQRDRNKKPSSAASRNLQRHVAVGAGGDGDVLSSHLERGNPRNQIRPQKLQKTGLPERQATTRFAPPGMQFKDVLSRNRKHHHPKLATPLKSPRASSVRSVSRVSRSRLIDAATRILEPGLVAKEKCKISITNPSSMTCIPADKVMLVGSHICMVHQANQSSNHVASPRQFVQPAACKNCGFLVENADFRPMVAARTSDCAASSLGVVFAPHQLGTTQPWPYRSPVEKEKKVPYRTNQNKEVSLATSLKNDLLQHGRLLRDEHHASQKFQEHRGQTPSGQNDESSSMPLKHGTVIHCCPSFREDRMPTRSKVSNFHKRRIAYGTDSVNGSEGFPGFNRKRTHEMVVMGVRETSDTNSDSEVAKISCTGQGSSLLQMNPVQERRSIHVERLVENPKFQMDPKFYPLTRKDFLVHYYNDALIKRPVIPAKGTRRIPKSVDCAISSGSNSSVLHVGEISISSNSAGTFSNCSCISRNLDDISGGYEVLSDFGNEAHDHPQTLRFGNLKQGIHIDVEIDLYARTCKHFHSFEVTRSRDEQSHVENGAADTELPFAGVNSLRTCYLKDIRVLTFLLSKLEKGANSSMSSITAFMGANMEGRRSYLREFLLDCLIEYLDTRFFCHDEFNWWKKLPLSLDLDTLIQDIEVEVRSWTSLSGMSIDEMIECQMNCSFEKWTDFQNESLVNGILIDGYIFQSLLEEIIKDLEDVCG
ncbi:hypothetical protein SAY87_026565 [Trapa incisa]|uniref:DUF4378 domain-containing protein n=1 Tax=Trapa incisa TaxID=236973 RepID=A0AAN7GQH6_9MYRT|nr:hypothetical protein SAY87_026565 [Trapa incisa]